LLRKQQKTLGATFFCRTLNRPTHFTISAYLVALRTLCDAAKQLIARNED